MKNLFWKAFTFGAIETLDRPLRKSATKITLIKVALILLVFRSLRCVSLLDDFWSCQHRNRSGWYTEVEHLNWQKGTCFKVECKNQHSVHSFGDELWFQKRFPKIKNEIYLSACWPTLNPFNNALVLSLKSSHPRISLPLLWRDVFN